MCAANAAKPTTTNPKHWYVAQVSREAQSRVQRALLTMSDMPSRTLTSRRGTDVRGEVEVEVDVEEEQERSVIKGLESKMRDPSRVKGGEIVPHVGDAADGRDGRGVDGKEGGVLLSPLSGLRQFFGDEPLDVVVVGEGGKEGGGGQGAEVGRVELEEEEEAETEEERTNRIRELDVDEQALHVELVLEDVHIDQVGTGGQGASFCLMGEKARLLGSGGAMVQ